MRFKADEIASVLQKEIEEFRGQVEAAEVGRVLEVGDGIARVYGLAGAMAGEMVEFPSGVRGQVFNLEENSVGVIILGDYLKIAEGDEVKSTGQLLSVPVGPAVIGRVVDPDILGGLRIRVGDTVYDGSLRARLTQLRHRVRERSLHEIQSGRNRFSHSERD